MVTSIVQVVLEKNAVNWSPNSDSAALDTQIALTPLKHIARASMSLVQRLCVHTTTLVHHGYVSCGGDDIVAKYDAA